MKFSIVHITEEKMKLYRGVTVFVRDGNVERALKKFKKKVLKKNIIQEVRDRQEYQKPSAKKKLKKEAARRRWLKEQRKNNAKDRKY
jgi:small subunit ribosomal protein S21